MPTELTKITDPSVWQQHGLAGLVILALFIIIGIGAWYFHKYNIYKDDMNKQERDESREESRKERVEWREDAAVRQEKTDGVIKEFSQSLRLLESRRGK